MDNRMMVLENIVTDDGMCVLRLLSDALLSVDELAKFGAPANAHIETIQEAERYQVRATWPICGPLWISCEGWPKPKGFVMWNLSLSKSVTAGIREANKTFEDVFLMRANYAYVRKLPRGVENGVEVGNLILFEADWMARKCVAVGFVYQ